jgi:glutaryl-CoA dehydrogenase
MPQSAIFHWDDPLRLDLQLTDIEKSVQLEAAAYAQERLLPRVIEATRTQSFDPAIVREMGERGFLGINLHDYGFRGLNHVCYGLVAREFERVDSAYRTVFSVQSSLAIEAIYLNGSAAQKEKYLPRLAIGELVGCFALTEPEYGSDPASMVTQARTVENGYRLDGQKKWIGLATVADVLIVWAKDKRGSFADLSSKPGRRDCGRPISKVNFRCALRPPAKSGWIMLWFQRKTGCQVRRDWRRRFDR